MDKQDTAILIVDDNEMLATFISEYLYQMGYSNISTAFNGEEALARLKCVKFHLILSDFSMPGMNGIQLLEKVKKQDDQVVFIMMSGEATHEKRNEARNKGAYAFLPKPFHIEELGTIIDAAIERNLSRSLKVAL